MLTKNLGSIGNYTGHLANITRVRNSATMHHKTMHHIKMKFKVGEPLTAAQYRYVKHMQLAFKMMKHAALRNGALGAKKERPSSLRFSENKGATRWENRTRNGKK
jgi:hypothetical protein